MKWSEVERRQPRLAALGRERLLDPGVVLVVTIRRAGDQYVAQWPPGREYVRRGITATSLGPPEPYTDLLVPD